MQDLTLSILGFSAVNRDLQVELRDPLSGAVKKTVKPFLDGTVRVSQIEAGAYELAVLHPQLPTPVLTRPIRVLPGGPTKVSVVIDPSRFRNTPIEDIPDANLSPVGDRASSIAETVAPLAGKVAGEAIRSSDWNAMAGAVRDLAETVGELARLVSPQGHDHPELVRKLDEITGNFQTLVESVSASLTELQRENQLGRVDGHIRTILTEAGIAPDEPRGKEFTTVLKDLEDASRRSPADFSRKSREAGVLLGGKIEQLLAEKPDLSGQDATKQLNVLVEAMKQQRSTTFQAEIDNQRKVDRQLKNFRNL